MNKVKTDPIDAFWMADFLRITSPHPTGYDIPALLQMQELTCFRF